MPVNNCCDFYANSKFREKVTTLCLKEDMPRELNMDDFFDGKIPENMSFTCGEVAYAKFYMDDGEFESIGPVANEALSTQTVQKIKKIKLFDDNYDDEWVFQAFSGSDCTRESVPSKVGSSTYDVDDVRSYVIRPGYAGKLYQGPDLPATEL